MEKFVTLLNISGLNDDDITYKKIEYLKHYVKNSVLYPEVKLTAERIVRDSQADEKKAFEIISAIFEWVKEKVYYVREFPENFKAPQTMLEIIKEEGQTSGDCDDFTILLASLLKSLGFSVAAKIVKAPGSDTYGHIYAQVRVKHEGKNKWLSLDATAKNKPIGWFMKNKISKRFIL